MIADMQNQTDGSVGRCAMKIVIGPNLEKRNAFETAVSVCERIARHPDVRICMEPALRDAFGHLGYIEFLTKPALYREADFVVAIGGDGTILRAASDIFCTSPAKLVGINTGRLGFLAAFEADELELLEQLFTGDYAISQRMVLRMAVGDADTEKTSYAVNDIYASRLGGRICDFSVFVDEALIGTFRADGIIFSTPTGSSAYALSAGGPVMEPDLSLIEMNLICPHSLFARPMLFSPKRKIRVKYSVPGESGLIVHVDGSEEVTLADGQSFVVTAAEERVPFVNCKGSAFYDALNGKLMRPIKSIGE